MSKRIAIDIGHGTNTSGKGVSVGGTFHREHTFNSLVGAELDRLLKNNGFTTIVHQKPNSPEVSLNNRIKYYNAQNVDLVWSIHADANGDKRSKGRYGFYWHTSKESKRLAELYAEEVKNAGYSTRGNGTQSSSLGNWTNLAICRDSKAVAVLTENGFMTNDEDFKLIFKSEKYIKDIAKIHAKAICKFYGVSFKEEGETAQPVVKPKPAVLGSSIEGHLVKAGDTLWGIAQENNTTVSALEKLNPGIDASALEIGSNIIVKKTEGSVVTEVKPTPQVKPVAATPKPVRPYPKKALKHGSRGRDVEAVQRALGFKGGAIDGIFGQNTERAVRNYQSRHKLSVDGIVGLNTWNTLF